MSAGAMRRAIEAAEKNALTLLRHLGVRDWREAMDGPSQDVVDDLLLADGTDSDAIVGLTERLGELIPLLSASRSLNPPRTGPQVPGGVITALEELERIAASAADEALQLGKTSVPKGHSGDLEVQGWVEDMGRLYIEVTGRRPTDWVSRNGRPSRFIRLLQAAGRPIGLDYSPQAWRRRARAYLSESDEPNQK